MSVSIDVGINYCLLALVFEVAVVVVTTRLIPSWCFRAIAGVVADEFISVDTEYASISRCTDLACLD